MYKHVIYLITDIWLYKSAVLSVSSDGIAEINETKVVVEVKYPCGTKDMTVAEAEATLKNVFPSTLLFILL